MYQRRETNSGIIFTQVKLKSPIAVTVRSETWVYCRSLAGIADLSPPEGMGIRLLQVLWVVWVAACATN